MITFQSKWGKVFSISSVGLIILFIVTLQNALCIDDPRSPVIIAFEEAGNDMFKMANSDLPKVNHIPFNSDTRNAVGTVCWGLNYLLPNSTSPREESTKNISTVFYHVLNGDISFWARTSGPMRNLAVTVVRERVKLLLRIYPISEEPQREELISVTQILSWAAAVDLVWTKNLLIEYVNVNKQKLSFLHMKPFLIALEVLGDKHTSTDMEIPVSEEEKLVESQIREIFIRYYPLWKQTVERIK